MRLIGFCTGVVLCRLLTGGAADLRISDDLPLNLPQPGSYALHILSPTVLELTLITTKRPDPARVETWDFINGLGKCRLPQPEEFVVSAADKPVAVKGVGFKRRVLYAPFKQRDLRIGSYLYLQLASPLPDNQTVEVKSRGNKLWTPALQFVAKMDPLRWSPVIHLNQTGYLASFSKKAMAGWVMCI